MATHRIRIAVLTVLIFTPLALGAQAPSSSATSSAQTARPLPVRRVVLYKSGVGFFEHLGRVRDNQSVTVDFTSAQLDDVLKSLTALDLGGGRVAGVNYNSEAGLDRRLSALRLPVGEHTTRAQFLSALRGAKVEVRTGATRVAGRLLSVESVQRQVNNLTSTVDAVAIVTDAGDVQTMALDPGVSVRIVEADLNEEVGKYLTAIASVRDRDVRQLTISTAGTGERDLYVAYVSEVPVWKATYRLVLPTTAENRQPFLQGWAIIDNTVGEDWENVELSLVAGAPQTFIQAISRPYYVQRPVVPLPERFLLAPQTHQSSITPSPSPVGAPVVGGVPPPPPPPPPSAPAGAGGRGGGGGVAFDRVQTLPRADRDGFAAASSTMPRPDAIEEVTLQQQADATAAQLGDLFEYRINTPVTIRKDSSALVPIVAADVQAEKVSLWNPSTGSRALRAVWLTNSTPLTLDGGAFSVVEGQAFAGEGLMDPLKAGEKRLLSFAVDLGLVLDAKGDTTPARVTKVTANRGVLIQQTEERQRRTYTARNEDADAKTLVIEHPARAGWTLVGVTPAESTPQWHRFRLTIAPRESQALAVEEMRPVETRIAVTNITDDQIALYLRDKALSPELETALRDVVARKSAIARLQGDVSRRQAEIDQIGRDQERVRENMKSLKGSSEERQLIQRYVKQLDDQETRIAAVRAEMQQLNGELDKARADLTAFIERIG